MATPRKHWFRVHSGILREPWTRDLKMTLVLLSAELAERWARDGLSADDACHATLSCGDLHRITGRSRSVNAELTLRSLGELAGITIERLGAFVTIHWPNWAEYQGLRSLESPRNRPELALSAPSPSPSPKKEEKTPRRGTKTAPPERLSVQQMEGLHRWVAIHKRDDVRLLLAELDILVERGLAWHRSHDTRHVKWYAAMQNWILGEPKKRAKAQRRSPQTRSDGWDQAALKLESSRRG